MLWCLKVPPVSKTGISLTLAFCTVFCVYWYESVSCRVFFFCSIPNLCSWNQGQNQSDVPQVINASPSQWDARNKLTITLLAPIFPSQPTSSTAEVLASGPAEPWKFHIHKEPISVLPPGALGVRQQLQTCRKVMAGRIGKLWLLCNKLKHYSYVTAI